MILNPLILLRWIHPQLRNIRFALPKFLGALLISKTCLSTLSRIERGTICLFARRSPWVKVNIRREQVWFSRNPRLQRRTVIQRGSQELSKLLNLPNALLCKIRIKVLKSDLLKFYRSVKWTVPRSRSLYNTLVSTSLRDALVFSTHNKAIVVCQ